MTASFNLDFFSFKDSPQVAKLLIEMGANVSEIDANGNTLLHRILNDRHFESSYEIIIRALIDNGVDVNAQNNDGDTPLHLTRKFWGWYCKFLLFCGHFGRRQSK